MAIRITSEGFNDEYYARSFDPSEQTRFWTCECGYVNDPPAHFRRNKLKCGLCKEPIERIIK